MTRKKIITIGSAMRDIFIDCACRTIIPHKGACPCIVIEEGRKVTVDQLTYAVGGGALNTAISFEHLGFDAYPIVKLGADCEADFLIKHLKTEQVHTDFVVRDQNAPTGASFIIPSPSGNRSVLVYRGASTQLGEQDIPYAKIQEATGLYIASLNGPAAQLLPHLARYAREHSIPLLVNPGTSQLTTQSATLIDALNDISMLILNAHEAHLLMQHLLSHAIDRKLEKQKMSSGGPELLHQPLTSESPYYLTDFFTTMHEYGLKIVVVTNGKEGVYASDATQIFFHPSMPSTVVSTIGAGDAFGAAFFAHYSEHASLPDALRAGSLNSAAALRSVGATTSVLHAQEMEDALKNIDHSLFKKYSF
jgi:sugar/nucleoside kinase (ribokinase family)